MATEKKAKPTNQSPQVSTTGHEWDGITEYDNPMPRWWLIIFYATIIWAIGYWIVMPAWPTLTGHTKGVLQYSSRAQLAGELKAAQEAQLGVAAEFAKSSFAEIKAKPDLLEYAIAGGRSAYSVNCSQCHGSGAAGSLGYPNLNDDDWLWGGSIDSILTTIQHGIRDPHDDNTRLSDMPRFGAEELLTSAQINQVVDYVLALNQKEHDQKAAEAGKAIFAEQCISCHGEEAKGNPEVGAPSLVDAVWLYGDSRASIHQSVVNSRRGVMPAWGQKLDAQTIRKLAIYVHSLGGGQ